MPESEATLLTMRAAVTGATGLIGRALVCRLESPVVLSRSPARASAVLPGVEAFGWEPEAEPAPGAALGAVDAVFNLAGEPIAAGRWTAERRRRIRQSRIIGTRHLVAGLAGLARRPRVLVSASAIGYYGDRGDEVLDEGSSQGNGFLAQVCAEWEREAMAATALGIRVVSVRLGVVLAPQGGALAKMLPLFRLGLGGAVAGGRAWMSWIHIDDLVGLLLRAATDGRLRGPLNAVAPGCVTNAEFTRELGATLRRPAWVPVPAFALRAVFGEMAGVLTDSQRVLPRVAEASGYAFAHGQLPDALANVLGAERR